MRHLLFAFFFCLLSATATQAQFVPGAGGGPGVTPSNNLLQILTALSTAKTAADFSAVADAIGSQLGGLDISGGINGLNGILPGDTAMGAPDLSSFGNIITAAQNGDLATAMNGLYTELTNRYNVPGLDPSVQQEIYGQLTALQGLMQNNSALNAGLQLAQNNVTNLLNSAGFGNVVDALSQLMNGTGDAESIAQTLANADWKKINETLAKLGMPGVDGLSKFLPPGVDPTKLGEILDAFKYGGIQGLLGSLEDLLKDKLINALPQDIPGLNDLIDKIGDLKNNPGALTDFLGGLLNGSGMGGIGATADCKLNPTEIVLNRLSASKGDLTKSPGIRICPDY